MPENLPQFCPDCGAKIRYIPAGISKKTGQEKKYNAFWSCSNRCGWTYHLEPKLEPTKETIKETKVIPILRLGEKDLEKILEPLRLIYKKIKDLERKFDNIQKVEIIYPNGKKEIKIETKPPIE